MTETKFLGVRLAPEIFRVVEEVAQEEHTDKSHALRDLILFGKKKRSEQRAIELYRSGKISVDKAADIAELTVSEMMFLLTREGVKSEESFSEYKKGLKILLK